MRKNSIVQKEYELECLSPVHIGSGETLKAFEYLYDKGQETAYFLDEAKWIAFLEQHQLMDAFARYLETVSRALEKKSPYKGQYVWEWLREKGITNEKIRSLGIRQAKAVADTMQGKKDNLNDIACQISMTDGRPYLPGSSLKGAMRTGILYHLLQENTTLKKTCWQKVKAELGKEDDKGRSINFKQQKKDWGMIVQNLENDLLGQLQSPHVDERRKKLTPQVKSVMRGLIVSDAVCDSGQETIILKKIDASEYVDITRMKEKTLPLSRECIPAGAKFRFRVAMDQAMLQEIGIRDANEIWEMCHEFVSFGLDIQKKVFGGDYEKEFQEAYEANLMLGGGTGFLSKSLLYALAPSEKEARDVVKYYLSRAFRQHRHEELDQQISPRTLKLTRTRKSSSLMGLCRVCEAGKC